MEQPRIRVETQTTFTAGGFFARAEAVRREQTAEQPEPTQQPPWTPPDTVLGQPTGTPVVIARTGDVAVALARLTAYPAGFEFTIQLALRRAAKPGRFLNPYPHHAFGDEPVPDEVFRLGVQFADGRAATNLDLPHPFTSPQPPPIVLQPRGGGGGRRYDLTYWVWPLPPPGPLTVVCAWPAHGITESRTELDSQAITDAAADAVDLFPHDPAN